MDYKKIAIEDRGIINGFYDKEPQWLAEYTFSTLLSWCCGGYEYRYKVEDDILQVIVVRAAAGDAVFLKPISKRKLLGPGELHSIAERKGIRLILCVDGHSFEAFNRAEWAEYFNVSEDKGWGNYYYLTGELAELKGGKFSKKRNLIKQFEREYGGDRTKVEECSVPLIKECVQLHEEWYRSKNVFDNAILERELTALKFSLEHFEALGLSGIGLFIDDKLRAFSVYEKLNEETMVVHFEKTKMDCKGLPQYFLNRIAVMVKDKFKYMNREGDMGDEGLRQAKRSNQPVFMERSLRLEMK